MPGSATSRLSVHANAVIRRSTALRRRASGTAHRTARSAWALPSTPTTTVLRASMSSSSYRRPRCRLRVAAGSGARPVMVRPLDPPRSCRADDLRPCRRRRSPFDTRVMTAELVEIRPTTRSDLDVVQRFATAAVRLPNGHPWHLRPVDQGFEIRADHARAARSTGLGARTVRLAVGAALFNVRLAVAVLGHQPVVSWSLDGPRSYVVAVVRRGVQRGPAPVERALFAAIASDGSAGSRSGGP